MILERILFLVIAGICSLTSFAAFAEIKTETTPHVFFGRGIAIKGSVESLQLACLTYTQSETEAYHCQSARFVVIKDQTQEWVGPALHIPKAWRAKDMKRLFKEYAEYMKMDRASLQAKINETVREGKRSTGEWLLTGGATAAGYGISTLVGLTPAGLGALMVGGGVVWIFKSASNPFDVKAQSFKSYSDRERENWQFRPIEVSSALYAASVARLQEANGPDASESWKYSFRIGAQWMSSDLYLVRPGKTWQGHEYRLD